MSLTTFNAFKLEKCFKGVDFDWDLSDKTDTETQTGRGASEPHIGPADAIVQVSNHISVHQ